MNMENSTTEEKYKKLAYLFEQYKGHKFKTFENVLMYSQKKQVTLQDLQSNLIFIGTMIMAKTDMFCMIHLHLEQFYRVI